MRKVCAKVVPKVLTDDQKSSRVEACQEVLDICDCDFHVLHNVITGDETWVFEYDLETQIRSAEWHTSASPCPKNARMSKSEVNVMLIVLFDMGGLVHHEFVPNGTTINVKLYVQVLKRLKRRVYRIQPDIADDWKHHHDNAPAHTAFLVTGFLTNSKVPMIPQLPYSPVVAPSVFFLFPRLKTPMKGHHFWTVDEVKEAYTKALKDIPDEAYHDASMPGNLAGSDVSKEKESILKPFNVFNRSNQ
ncbi:hypothetical protein B7P43_G04760 [Cryptotermes secundus]|uniref:Mariner Mos1 transposase n=1 Tax=Cryptotermes secundus TaxID=105785 RepID=A0A2J7Q4V1_9NEOP|nr:hypothetical protein B7P43_G04760 [Cryptotermes secundus]